MRKCLLPIIILLFATTVKAQYVNIPDINFRNFLISQYPACFNASKQMDTTCSAIIGDTILSCGGFQILSLEGVQYFDSLRWLSCAYNNQLSYLPALPNSLRWLSCESNQLSYLPALPNGLTRLDCSQNQLTSLPNLPQSLTYFDCNRNQLTTLPPLPINLTYFNCYQNQLTSLPQLGSSIVSLHCSINKLTNLPALPNTLRILSCDYNQLVTLPTLPNSLTQLHCKNNKLITLSNLPIGLNWLECDTNKLTSLPILPNGLQRLYCNDNNIYCLPYLPKTLYSSFFLFDVNKIKCIPNPVVGFSYPVCNAINNVNGCPSFGFANVEGKIFYDANNNGVVDGIEIYSNNTMVNFADILSVITNNNGYYNFATDSLSIYFVTPITPIANTVFNPQFATISFNKIDTVVTQNFAIQPTSIKDSIETTLTISDRIRAGYLVSFQVDIKNTGTSNLANVSSVLSFDNSKLIFNTCKPFSFVNTGNSITVNLPTIPFGGHYTYYGWFNTKTTVAIGDTIKFNTTTTNGSLFENITTYTLVSASFDPNDKQATPELSTTQVTEGKRIDYTIRFQNTGNDTAFHIVIADTLDSKLNLNSLQMIATSHLCKTTIKDNIIFFEMRDIMLPDSNVNKLGSNGFIRFTMQPKNTVVAGNNIPNKAAIYFDYNAPIITNTAITQIKNPILPVKFSKYEVRCTNCENNLTQLQTPNSKQILNSWTTASEINTSHFIVQRSEDGRVYKSVGKVAAKGFGTYSFIDPFTINNLPLTIYYRLIAVDKDGSYQFSEVKQITINNQQQAINIYPNPTATKLTITRGTNSTVKENATLTDITGKKVMNIQLNSLQQTIDISELQKGIYMLCFENGEKLKVVKQ